MKKLSGVKFTGKVTIDFNKVPIEYLDKCFEFMKEAGLIVTEMNMEKDNG